MQTMLKTDVDETKPQLNQRINLHRSDVNTHTLERSPIAEHIHTTGHTFSDISLCCIDHNPIGPTEPVNYAKFTGFVDSTPLNHMTYTQVMNSAFPIETMHNVQ